MGELALAAAVSGAKHFGEAKILKRSGLA